MLDISQMLSTLSGWVAKVIQPPWLRACDITQNLAIKMNFSSLLFSIV